jgi:hypothetical protein
MCTWPNKYSALTGKLIHQVAGHLRHNTILKLYARDTSVISTKRCEKPSDNTSTVDRDALYYM